MRDFKKYLTSTLMVILVGALSVSCAQDQEEADELSAAPSSSDNQPTLDDFLATLPQLNGYYIYQGDMLRTDEEIAHDLALQNQSNEAGVPNSELKIHTVGGVPQFYEDLSSRVLSYAIDKASFDSAPDGAYEKVRSEIATAFTDWEGVCPECQIHFVNTGVTQPQEGDQWFIVKYESEANFVAAAFFPNYHESRRYLTISSQYFTSSFDPVGVIRHETGHILGYRHEHIDGISGCRKEGNDWLPISVYDPNSVMHYFCGGGGSLALQISEIDIQSHRLVYLNQSN